MKPQPTTSNRGEFKRLAEGLYQYSQSKEYYARFRHRGERIMQKLGSNEHPCTSLPEAKRLLRDLKNCLEHTDTRKSNKTLGEVITDYESVLHCAPKTRVYKSLHLRRLRTEFPCRLATRVRDIQKTDVAKFLAQYNHLSAAGWNAILTVTRDVFEYAIQDGVIARSPAESVTYRKREDKNKRLVPSWTEFEKIVEHVRFQKLSDTAKQSADLIEFMGLAGLGQAECADLTWGDINFDSGRITIIRKKTSKEFAFPIYPALLPLLQRMDKEREDKNASAKVFRVKDPKIALGNACKRLNLPNYSARAFRRMFITRALELGIDAQTIASWQGHRDGGQLILKVYARVSEEHTRKMASLMTNPASANVTPIGSTAA
jgi:integrase